MGDTIYKDNNPTTIGQSGFIDLLGMNTLQPTVQSQMPQKSGDLGLYQALMGSITVPAQTNPYLSYGSQLIQNSSNPIYKYSYDQANGRPFQQVDYNRTLISSAAQSILGNMLKGYGEKQAKEEQQQQMQKIFEAIQVKDPALREATGFDLSNQLAQVSPQAALLQRLESYRKAQSIKSALLQKGIEGRMSTDASVQSENRKLANQKELFDYKAKNGEGGTANPELPLVSQKELASRFIKMSPLSSKVRKEYVDMIKNATSPKQVQQIRDYALKTKTYKITDKGRAAISTPMKSAETMQGVLGALDSFEKKHGRLPSYIELEVGNLLPWGTDQNAIKATLDFVGTRAARAELGAQNLSDKDTGVFTAYLANTKQVASGQLQKVLKKMIINAYASSYLEATRLIPQSGRYAENEADRIRSQMNEPEMKKMFWEDFAGTEKTQMLPIIRELYGVEEKNFKVDGKSKKGFLVRDLPALKGSNNSPGDYVWWKDDNGHWLMRKVN